MPTISELKKNVLIKAEELDLSRFIILDGRIGCYPDIYLAKERTRFGLKWYDSHKVLHETDSNLSMESPIMLIDLISDLRSGKKLYNGNGTKMGSKESEQILDEIVGVRKPLRGEWLNASFEIVKGHGLYLKSNYRFIDGKLVPEHNEPLEQCIMEDCRVNLLSANRQGFPMRKDSDGVSYFYPRHGAVAMFDAYSDGTILYCDGDTQFSGPALRVRVAKNKE
ncbi:hypothetical protein HYX17_00225 [Candidatus Woesearchaeota archaeon]|nr:hypothetical protein [Candidatus Woesearchaeota archaeon]